MKYLIVDAELGGTGIKNQYDSEIIKPIELGISSNLISRLETWLQRYQELHYRGYDECPKEVESLDREGLEIALLIKMEIKNIKISYHSDATGHSKVILV